MFLSILSVFPQKMGKKKMSKEEKKRFEAEKAEILRIEMEKERFFIHSTNKTTIS